MNIHCFIAYEPGKPPREFSQMVGLFSRGTLKPGTYVHSQITEGWYYVQSNGETVAISETEISPEVKAWRLLLS